MYPVTDVPRAVEFYEGALGLKKTEVDLPYWVEFEAGGATFGVGTFEQVGTAGSAQSLALEISDLPALRAQLKARGIESDEPHESPICWISGVKDPDGNQVWLHQSKPR
jgi:predicted enzyme related to lactoylglutathione lyase